MSWIAVLKSPNKPSDLQLAVFLFFFFCSWHSPCREKEKYLLGTCVISPREKDWPGFLQKTAQLDHLYWCFSTYGDNTLLHHEFIMVGCVHKTEKKKWDCITYNKGKYCQSTVKLLRSTYTGSLCKMHFLLFTWSKHVENHCTMVRSQLIGYTQVFRASYQLFFKRWYWRKACDMKETENKQKNREKAT